jgi:GNAT superfamily N-acetyltransferase
MNTEFGDGELLVDEILVAEVTEFVPLDAIRRLRVRAWAAEGLLPPGTLPDGTLEDPLDQSGRHWVVRVGYVLAAAARLTIHPTGHQLPDQDQRLPETVALPGPVAALNRLVVCPEYRGRGLARLLDQARVGAARSARCRFAVVAAHGSRVAALQAFGFTVVCGVVSQFLATDGSERAVESAAMLLPLQLHER